MILATEESSAATTPGKRYVLAISNGSGGAIVPQFTAGSVTEEIVPENSVTAFSVAAGTFRWIEFPAIGTLVFVPATADVYWSLIPID